MFTQKLKFQNCVILINFYVIDAQSLKTRRIFLQTPNQPFHSPLPLLPAFLIAHPTHSANQPHPILPNTLSSKFEFPKKQDSNRMIQTTLKSLIFIYKSTLRTINLISRRTTQKNQPQTWLYSRNYNYYLKIEMNFGIEALEIYFPKTYVDQTDLQKHYNVSAGKHTIGLGQLQLSFAYPLEDPNSLALTVLNNLLKNHNIHPSQVGRLEVGTQSLTDKSKSAKTLLMTLFADNHDIEGTTSINACYGATNALFNTLNWISSPSWDGRYGIVVATDVAVYEEGPARPTGGAGAVALLISNKPKIVLSPIRASYMDHQYDFYKPVPSSEYPIVDGKLSVDCYIRAMKACYNTLKHKKKGENLLESNDYVCFHTPFHKMVQKAYDALLKIENPTLTTKQTSANFDKKVQPSLFISQRTGNIYTGSLFSSLFSLLYQIPTISNKKVLLFSYGSGLCSSLFQAYVTSNPLSATQIKRTDNFFKNRIRVTAKQYSDIMLQKEKAYGKWKGKVHVDLNLIDDNVFYLDQIDQKWRRTYKTKTKQPNTLVKNDISAIRRIQNIDKLIPNSKADTTKFYKLTVEERRDAISDQIGQQLNDEQLQRGGLSMKSADGMIENVIGKISLPLGIVPKLQINRKQYTIPMCIEEPSVVAATSSIGKFISPYSFNTSSTPNIMVGQVHLPSIQPSEVNQIIRKKASMISQLNQQCLSMVKRGGGVKDIRMRQLQNKHQEGDRNYSLDILLDVCDAMGANLTNTIAEKAKQIVSKMGIKTGISILSNYCLERKAVSTFLIPVEHMAWKGVSGLQVANKILEAYDFAKSDIFRAVTHNKGIMNGIDAVCVATGQDWRAVQSAAHSYASRSGKYQPLTKYELLQKDGKKYFKGSLELPLAVGTAGGAISRNSLYKTAFNILGNPSAQELSQILVSVGLAQNFGALRALAIEGIQKGHMKLHGRAIAAKLGVPSVLMEDCCRYMSMKKKYDQQTVLHFLQEFSKPRL